MATLSTISLMDAGSLANSWSGMPRLSSLVSCGTIKIQVEGNLLGTGIDVGSDDTLIGHEVESGIHNGLFEGCCVVQVSTHCRDITEQDISEDVIE